MSTNIYLIIAAGGSGTRMCSSLPKQFYTFNNTTILELTTRAFLTAGMPKITNIIIAIPKNYIRLVESWIKHIPIPIKLVFGGLTRQESIINALNILPNDGQAIVMIHDAARPFPPIKPIQDAIHALSYCDGVTLGEKSTDTLKRIDNNQYIIKTEPRENIFRAQTPQLARLSLWLQAFNWAKINEFHGTDDVALLEALGKNIKMIPSPSSNFKITSAEDWIRVQQILQYKIDI